MHNKAYAMDVNEVNKAVFKSLKPGGYYVIIDHKAAESAGDDVTETLHRVKESTAKKEVEAAGFKLVAEGHDLDIRRPTTAPSGCSTPMCGARPTSSCSNSRSPVIDITFEGSVLPVPR